VTAILAGIDDGVTVRDSLEAGLAFLVALSAVWAVPNTPAP
jgi:hypothetical protein